MKEIITNACLVISGQLNPSALQDSLGKLVEIWPILGARLRKNNDVCLIFTWRIRMIPLVLTRARYAGPT